MSNQDKNTIAKKALIEMDNITAALKEESKKSLNTLLSEAVKTALREECADDDDCEYEVTDNEKESPKDKKEKKSSKKSGEVDEDEDEYQTTGNLGDEPDYEPQSDTGNMNSVPTSANNNTEQSYGPEDGVERGANDQEDQSEDVFSKYQVGDNTYDLTGENDQEMAVKVYKLLNNDDKIIVKQDGENLHLIDNEADTEYVIDFGSEDNENQYSEDEVPTESQLNEEEDFDVAGFPEDEDDEPDLDLDINDEESDFGNEFDDDSEYDDLFDGIPSYESPEVSDEWYNLKDDSEELFGSDKNNVSENKFSRKPMKNKKDVLFEIDLGYTDNYQDKDPIAGLSNNEPSKSGKSWHKGVPTGTEKSWAGDSKSKGTPFEKTKEVNEEEELASDTEMSGDMEEATNVGGAVQQRSNSKSHIPNNRKEHGPHNKRHVSTAEGGYDEIVAEMKTIKKQNKQLKESVKSLLSNLKEAYVTNYNLGKITKLFVENVTTQDEKVDIVNRFAAEAKTTKQSDVLFESIQRELQKSHSDNGLNLNESSVTAKGTKQLNESLNYASNDLLKTKDLMNRIMNM